MKNKIIISTIFSFLAFTIVCAQNLCQLKVINNDKQPIAFAEVVIEKNGTLLIQNLTDENGIISFACIPATSYLLTIKDGGNTMKEEINIEEGKKVFEVIYTPTIMLKEVVITSKKKYFKQGSKALVVNINGKNDLGNNASQILSNSPGIEIIGDNLSFLGKQVLVEVNGKKTNFSSAQLLQFLKNNGYQTIEKIELIANPGAKYESDFDGRVINIITINKKEGFDISINSEYVQRYIFPSYYSGLNFNYYKNGINVYSNLSFGYSKRRESRESTQSITALQRAIYDKINNDYTNKGLDYVVGLDWYMTNKTVAGIDIQGYYNKNKGHTYGLSEIYNYQQLDSIRRLDNYTNSRSPLINVNLNLKSELDTLKSYVNFDLDIGVQKEKKDNQQSSKNYLLNETLTNNRLITQNIDNHNRFFSASGEWIKNFNNLSMESGLKYNFSKINQDIDEISPFVPNTGNHYTNQLDYNEHIIAAFSEISGKFKNYKYQLGLRLEHTQYSGKAQDFNSDINKHYFNLFPKIKISRNFNKHYVSLGFSRYIKRPRFYDLIPFKRYTGNFSYFIGNPYLLSYFPYSYEIYYSYNGLWTSGSYNYAKDRILEYERLLPNSNIREGVKGNNGSYSNLRFSVGYNKKLTDWFRISSSARLTNGKEKFTTTEGNNKEFDYTAYSLWTSPKFYYKDFQLNTNFYYNSDVYYGVTKTLNYWFLDLGIIYSFWNNNAQLSFDIRDIFKSNITRTIHEYGNINVSNKNDWGSRQFILGIQFYFGNENTQSKRKKESGNKSTINRL